MTDIDTLIKSLSNDFTKILHIDEIKPTCLYWGGNGVGDRFANKKYNYSVIYNSGKTKTYSENTEENFNDILLKEFIDKNKKDKGSACISGIYVHSKRENVTKRTISKKIDKIIKGKSCVVCGSNSDIICDHKNDLYNDEKVLDIKTQSLDDFQALCNHCNLQKRQICKNEIEINKIYSVKNIPQFSLICDFDIPWEKKIFDVKNKYTKMDTYWYDPIEFNRKLKIYIKYIIPLNKEIRLRKI